MNRNSENRAARRTRVPCRELALLIALASAGGVGLADEGQNGTWLRNFIDQQVGGIDKLKVPATNAGIPVPPPKPGEPDRYLTTEAKRFLGKMLFHDPVRTNAHQHQRRTFR